MPTDAEKAQFEAHLKERTTLQVKAEIQDNKITGWRRDRAYQWIEAVDQKQAKAAGRSARNANMISVIALLVAIAALLRDFWPKG